MPDMLSDGAAMVADEVSAHASQTVTYRRGGSDITGLKAARGQPIREIDSQFGILRIVGMPWFIKPELLVFGAETWTPQKNDLIIEANWQVWQLLPTQAEAELVLGSFGKLWRVESKRIEAG